MTTKMAFQPKGANGPGDRINAAIAKIGGLSTQQRGEVREAFVKLMKGGR
jgi:hypothetical protein